MGGAIRPGADTHRDIFCRFLLDTYDPYKPAVIDWPELEPDALARLTGLPFWHLAVTTEGWAALRMETYAKHLDDPLIREAVLLNAFEEQRHKHVLGNMIRFYGIKIDDEPDYAPPPNPAWSFLRLGYGECFDSFFAFGLFRVAKESGFFAPELVEVFEPVVQEEARHNIFFANWLVYTQRRHSLPVRPWFLVRRLMAVAAQIQSRMSLAKGLKSGGKTNVTAKGHEAMGIKLSTKGLLKVCLEESERRFGIYDQRLLRPRLIPRLVKMALPLMRG